jgi:hypothetical protein
MLAFWIVDIKCLMIYLILKYFKYVCMCDVSYYVCIWRWSNRFGGISNGDLAFVKSLDQYKKIIYGATEN